MNIKPEELLVNCFVLNGENGDPIFNGDLVSFRSYKEDASGVSSTGVIQFSSDLLRFEIAVFDEDISTVTTNNPDDYTVSDFLPFGQDFFDKLNALAIK